MASSTETGRYTDIRSPVTRSSHGGRPPNLSRVSTTFEPHRLVRPAVVQTVLSTVSARAGIESVIGQEQPLLLDAGADETGADPARPVRLLAYCNRTETERHGLVLLLHGWEGCSHSSYNLLTTEALLRHGYDVVRLNLRDHGPGRHVDPYALNKGVFLGTLINEAATAAQHIARFAGNLPFYIVGTSLGGNFALRLARAHGQRRFHNLAHVVAFSPAINPDRATRAIDEKPAYQAYFRHRWSRSLRRKQELFPDIHDFADVLNIPSIYEMTDVLVRRSGRHASAEEYFAEYGVQRNAFSSLSVPTTIVTALDDAVIPVVDFYALTPHPLLTVRIERFGGHVGWVDIFPFRHWLPEMLLDVLEKDSV